MVDAVVRAMSCCCVVGDQTDAHQISYHGENPKFEEGRFGHSLALPPSDSGAFMTRPSPGRLGDSEPLSSRTGSAPNTARSMTPEERQKEKERLQDMVKEFAKAAVQSQQCQWVLLAAGAPHAAAYSLDKALRHFSVRSDDGEAATIEMASIAEVSKDVRGTPFAELQRLPPPHALSGETLDRRFVCVHHVVDGRLEHLGLLLPNPFERERFYTCMKILRWAIDSRRDRS